MGPPGEEIWTDEYGRVKVRFVWDRYGTNSESDSCWLRVSQAGEEQLWWIYIPRIGQEVIVDCINGDPDRPMVMGSLYNNVTRPLGTCLPMRRKVAWSVVPLAAG